MTTCTENVFEPLALPRQKLPNCINTTFLDCYNLAQIFCYVCLYDRKQTLVRLRFSLPLFLIFHNSWMSLECLDVFETVILGVLLVDLELMGFPRAGKFLGRGGAVVGSLLLPRLKWRLTRSRRLSQSIIQNCVLKTQT